MRYPIKDQVAIAGVGSTGFTRSSGRSSLSLALEASTKAILDAGLTAADVDAVFVLGEGGAPTPQLLASSLGVDEVTYFSRPTPVVMFSIIDAMSALHAGVCDTALVVSSMLRLPGTSRSAANDPFRRQLRMGGGARPLPESINLAAAYAAWAGRYVYEHGTSREPFGRVAINARTNAGRNPLAVMRTPLTMDDYLAARMIREPLCLLDMDIPADGADAFVLTTAERARSLAQPPVLIHVATAGLVGNNTEDQLESLAHHGQHVVVKALKARSDIWLDDIDVYFPYDGFSIITLAWMENAGWCPPGGAERFIAEHWDEGAGRILINGRVPVNPHGGSLSEAATRGTGHLREAVLQLRGSAGDRQVPGARAALVTPGGFFFNSQGAVLRAG
jgi:acetyl-CoA acetyltransferase